MLLFIVDLRAKMNSGAKLESKEKIKQSSEASDKV